MSDSTQLLARILMSIVFIVFGYLQFTNIAGYAANPSVLKVVALTGGVLSPTVIAYLVAAIDLLGGILILIGFQTHRTALVLIIFCICTLFIAHNFWTMEGPARAGNMGNFYKNLALIGGLLLLMNSGHGAYSVDAKMAKTSATGSGRPPDPHFVVVEGRAAIGRDRIRAGQRVDAAAVGIGRIRPDRFRDQHAAPHAVEQLARAAAPARAYCRARHNRRRRSRAPRRRPDGSSPSGASPAPARSASR